MKFTASLIALGALLVGAASTEAAAVDRPGPWSEIHHKNSIKHFKVFGVPAGTNLRSVRPLYYNCSIKFPSAKESTYKYFAEHPGNEFQMLGRHTLGINCPDCTAQETYNFYSIQLARYFTCANAEH
ncbi:uncharacterized protein UMAG_03202 [Mycosarcoma maydis]|uniref:Uncharacterized protein n=1 Tax=Mycosarcoma maydis TaxID=5270 RepID=A0A0D1C4R8_MYCMD|nr:uncharacterized protein UMAG_03202 [Ustilago maydis 521]KIS68627.1 hypothetical protein UMAG_03202 [Ustilago maydis 521]|eukprot:XP_011389641.1 hypothetical protein UMAG_03202 [Ustilago maydis 521]